MGGLGNQLRNPLRHWMIGHAQRDQASPVMSQDHQDRQQPEIDRRHDEEVHGADPSRVIAQERLPGLAGPSGPALGHILGDGGLSDLDPELQQLAVNACSGFSTLIRRIRVRTSIGTLGLPTRDRDF
jgi:hypothetical protein